MIRWSRALLVVVFASRTALAAGSFHASYAAPEGCPSQDDFVRAVEQRLPDWRHSESPAEREIRIVIEKTDAGFKGALSLSPSPQVREVEGPRCDSVMRALALVAAVSLDPTAALGAEPSSEAPAPPSLPPTEPRASPPPPEDEARGPSFGFGAGGALMFGPAPAPLYGVEAHAEIGTATRSFLVRVAGARLVTGSVSVGSGTARFELTHAELGGCYLPIRKSVSVMGCLVLDGGSVEAAGEPSAALAETKTSRRFWGASGGRLGFGVRLATPLELGTSLGVLIPWRSQKYVFQNPPQPSGNTTETLYETSPVALDLRLGLTVIFPSGDQE